MHNTNIPLILSPPTITNYSQFKTFLSQRITKKAFKSTKYTDEFFPQNFILNKNYKLTTKMKKLDIDKILKSNLQQKLIKKQEDIEKQGKLFFNKLYSTKIKKLVCEYKQRVHLKEKVRLDDIESLELDFIIVNKELFTNNTLKDCYELLECQKQGIKYMQFKYEEFMDKNVKGKDKMSSFIYARYGRDEFKMDIYENRCLYAELYLSIRTGNFDHAKDVLLNYNLYFEGSSKGFVALMTEYINNLNEEKESENLLYNQSRKQALFLLHMTNASTDRFKVILLKLMSRSPITENEPVIDTLEDFIFYILLTIDSEKIKNEIYKMFKDFPNDSGKLFAYLLADMNDKAIEAMFEGNFSVYECYFLMQNMITKDVENYKYFVHLVFLIAKNFKSNEKKFKIINNLKKYNFIECNQLIVDNIVKFRLFEIIYEKGVDKQIIKLLGEELKERNENSIILENYHIFNDDKLLLSVYCNTIKDIIINNKTCDLEYLDKLFLRYDGLNVNVGRKASMLNEFFLFYKDRNEQNFRKTIICGNFEEEIDKELISVLERILLIACNLFRKEKNKYCLERILCFVGHYRFGNETIGALNNEMLDML